MAKKTPTVLEVEGWTRQSLILSRQLGLGAINAMCAEGNCYSTHICPPERRATCEKDSRVVYDHGRHYSTICGLCSSAMPSGSKYVEDLVKDLSSRKKPPERYSRKWSELLYGHYHTLFEKCHPVVIVVEPQQT